MVRGGGRADTAYERAERPLLEREGVLAALAAHWASAAGGRGRVALVYGEAGIGKSAVLDRVAAQVAATGELLRGWCDPLSTPRPLGPWVDVADGLGLSIESRAGGVSSVFRVLMDALASGEPRALVLEDVHWADAATLDLVRLLARRIERLPVLLVVSYRDDEIGPGHPLRALLGDLSGAAAVYRCAVEPLSRDGVARLADGRRPDVDELYRVTGGNPFFLTELLATTGAGVPASVTDAIAGRLSRVSAAGRRAAEMVAVIGSPSSVRLLSELAGGTMAGVEELLQAGLLQDMDGGVGFRHELARAAVLEAIPAFQRSAMHGRVLELLRADPAGCDDSALLAHHASAAGDAGAVLEHAPAAGDHAAAIGANREAAAHYASALRFGSRLSSERRAAFLEKLAHAALGTRFVDAIAAMREAMRLRHELGDSLREGNDLRWLSGVLLPSGWPTESWEAGERAVRMLEALPASRELAWAHVNMCQLSAYNHRGTALAEEHGRRALSLAEQLGDTEAGWQARFHLAAARYVCSRGVSDGDRAWADMERAREGAFQAGLPGAAAFMAMQAAWLAAPLRDHRRASAAVDLLKDQSLEREIFSLLVCGRGYRALGLLHHGSWEQAADLAASVLDQVGQPTVSRILPLLVVGLVRARRGDPDVWQPLDDALRSFEPVGWALLIRAARAEAAWLEGDEARARAEATLGLEAITPHTNPWVTGELARWAWLAGAELPRTVDVARPIELEMAGEWSAAAAIWDEMGCHYDGALARLAGDVSALSQALETFGALGARSAAERARSRLRSLGVHFALRGPRSATRAHPHGLTERQAEIVALIAEGMTDQKIAARLHLSPKTVNHHVTAALAKLGVHTRADAVRKLAEP